MVSLVPLDVDDPRAHALLEEYFQMRAQTFPVGQTYQPTFPVREAFEPPAGIFLVAVNEGLDVGCAGIRRLPDTSEGGRYELKHLYLRPETRGRGWGRHLVAALVEQAREWDAYDLVLDTHHTLTAAGALYASQGFAETERYNDNPNATRWYRKVL